MVGCISHQWNPHELLDYLTAIFFSQKLQPINIIFILKKFHDVIHNFYQMYFNSATLETCQIVHITPNCERSKLFSLKVLNKSYKNYTWKSVLPHPRINTASPVNAILG